MIALAAAALSLGSVGARAGDDGAAPLWEGLGSIVAPIVGFGHEEKPPIEYQEHGKLVVPKSLDLPPPGGAAVTTGGAWPVNQEILRKKAAKDREKAQSEHAGVDTRTRITRSFPNAPVTVGAADQSEGVAAEGKAAAPSLLSNLNPLGWVGIGKDSKTPVTEPDRDWLTDPPKGYRAPVAAATVGAAQQSQQATKPAN